MTENKKSYYAIIPAHVRYDETLTPNAKLLYGEVTALCNERGYCWASNSYFADLYNVSNVSISKWINQLVKQGYLTSEMQYKEGSKEILHRYLRIVNDPIKEKFNTPQTKVNAPIKEKFKDNNTINNTINNTYNTKQKSNKLPEKDLKSDFDSIWKEYPNKKGKAKAFTSYKKAIKEGIDNQTIINGISAYKKEIEIKRTEPEYVAHGSTWFSQQRWEDDYQTNQSKPLDLDNVFDEKDNADQWARWEERKNASNR